MICPACGANNPNFFIHCVRCGKSLPGPGRSPAKRKRILVALVAGACVLLALGVILTSLPAITGAILALPAFFSASPAPQVPEVTRFSLNEPARYGDLLMTVNGARDGTGFNGRKFYTVTVSLHNFQTSGTLHYSGNDFLLADGRGEEYRPAGLNDGITFDLGPETTGSVDLHYIIPDDERGLRLLFDPRSPLEKVSGREMFYEFVL